MASKKDIEKAINEVNELADKALEEVTRDKNGNHDLVKTNTFFHVR